MNDFRNELNNAMEKLSADRDIVSSAKIRAAAERPERKISAKRIFGTAAAVCAVLVCGISVAAATGLIDFEAVFGTQIIVNDSDLASSLMGTVKNFKYKVSDKDYKIEINGVTGDDKNVVVAAEISRKDGTPVADCFVNPVQPDEKQLLPLSQITKVSSLNCFGYSMDYRINETGNIDLSMQLYDVGGLNGRKMTFKGENFYPAGEYIKFEHQNEKDESVQTEHVKYNENAPVSDSSSAVTDLNEIVALDLKWEFSFTYKQSEKSQQVKSLDAPEDSFTLNMNVHTFKPVEDHICKVIAQPSYVEAGSTGGRIDFVYKDIGYVGNLTYVTNITGYNEVYVIMSDGERVKADFNGGYEKPDGNICTCSYDLAYWDENDYKIFINADDIEAISINGTVYELQ